MVSEKTICIVGLGYVGLPLANAFSKFFNVIGFDINKEKINNLKNKYFNINFTFDSCEIKKADFVIITVPTPITIHKEPDLSFIKSASEIVGKNLKKGSIVVLESTVYPGVTEEIVVPIIEESSGYKLGKDFKIGYSPERINPGDNEHAINKITKIVSGIDKESTDILTDLYNHITNVYNTENIKTAEAAKIIENIQRDLNIALINELAIIFNKLDLSIKSILDAASTKWNFHRYNPGLVGGHCIPVDPYYLVYKTKDINFYPKIILAGRSVNDYMPKYIAEMIIKSLNETEKVIMHSKVLIIGLSYKENVDDIRESPIKSLIKELREYKIEIYGYDPLIDKKIINNDFKIKILDNFFDNLNIDCVVISVVHDIFKKIKLNEIKNITNKKPVLIDIKRFFNAEDSKNAGFLYKTI